MSVLGTFPTRETRRVLCQFCGSVFPYPKNGVLGRALEDHIRHMHAPQSLDVPRVMRWMIEDGVFEVLK